MLRGSSVNAVAAGYSLGRLAYAGAPVSISVRHLDA